MAMKPFQSERLHTMGGALLGISVGLRKLKKVIEPTPIFAGHDELHTFWKDQLIKIDLSVEKLSKAFTELRTYLAEESANDGASPPAHAEPAAATLSPLVLIHDASHAAALQVALELQTLGFRTQCIDQLQELSVPGAGDCLVLGLASPLSVSLEICSLWRRSAASARLPLLILTADEAEADLLPFLALGIDGFCPKSLVKKHMAVQVYAALKRAEISQAQLIETERSAAAELALSLLMRPQVKAEDIDTFARQLKESLDKNAP